MIQQVLDAIRDAFHPADVRNHLRDVGGHVVGSVEVIGSPAFDKMDDIRRQRAFWDQMRVSMGVEALHVGPVILDPTTSPEPKVRG